MRALSWSCGVWECSSISSYLERIPSMTPRYKLLLNRMTFYGCWLWPDLLLLNNDYDLICPGHNTCRVASSTQWCVPQVLGADTGPNALISQLLSCYLDPLFRLFWRRTLIIGPLSGTSKNTSGYCKRLNNITQFWALNWIWGSEPGGCKSVPTVWCHPLLWVRAATSHPLQVSVSLIFIEHTWSGQK